MEEIPALQASQMLLGVLSRRLKDLKTESKARSMADLHQEETALKLLRTKLRNLDQKLRSLQRLGPQTGIEKAELLPQMDAARRELLAAARDNEKRIIYGKDAVSHIITFCDYQPAVEASDGKAPRQASTKEWQVPVVKTKTRQSREDIKWLQMDQLPKEDLNSFLCKTVTLEDSNSAGDKASGLRSVVEGVLPSDAPPATLGAARAVGLASNTDNVDPNSLPAQPDFVFPPPSAASQRSEGKNPATRQRRRLQVQLPAADHTSQKVLKDLSELARDIGVDVIKPQSGQGAHANTSSHSHMSNPAEDSSMCNIVDSAGCHVGSSGAVCFRTGADGDGEVSSSQRSIDELGSRRRSVHFSEDAGNAMGGGGKRGRDAEAGVEEVRMRTREDCLTGFYESWDSSDHGESADTGMAVGLMGASIRGAKPAAASASSSEAASRQRTTGRDLKPCLRHEAHESRVGARGSYSGGSGIFPTTLGASGSVWQLIQQEEAEEQEREMRRYHELGISADRNNGPLVGRVSQGSPWSLKGSKNGALRPRRRAPWLFRIIRGFVGTAIGIAFIATGITFAAAAINTQLDELELPAVAVESRGKKPKKQHSSSRMSMLEMGRG